MRVSAVLVKLQDTTAEIRVRGAFLLLTVFIVLASKFGLEAILGAFLAGATLKLVDRDQGMTHAFFHQKLQAVGFGVFIPFFFVSTGHQARRREPLRTARRRWRGCRSSWPRCSSSAGLPALLYRPARRAPRQLVAAGLLQATSLSIPVVAGQIGVEMGLIRPENYVALVAAGLLSVIVFPFVALRLLRQPRPLNG